MGSVGAGPWLLRIIVLGFIRLLGFFFQRRKQLVGGIEFVGRLFIERQWLVVEWWLVLEFGCVVIVGQLVGKFLRSVQQWFVEWPVVLG